MKNYKNKFWENVYKTNFCWFWLGSKDGSGYGKIFIKNKYIGAHRYSYEINVGKIPKNYHIDHLCMNPPCVNPNHLDPVTRGENIRRAHVLNGNLQCKKGHRYIEGSFYISKKRKHCKICEKIRKS